MEGCSNSRRYTSYRDECQFREIRRRHALARYYSYYDRSTAMARPVLGYANAHPSNYLPVS